MAETVSAVLVQVPEAERVVSRHRARLDAAATAGVPAHVTVLFPFVAPAAITAGTLEALAAAVAPVSAFDCEFSVTAWFGSDVLWLAPRPDEPFRAGMTVVIQPNVVTKDHKAGVQTGELVLITRDGIERMHAMPRGFAVLG